MRLGSRLATTGIAAALAVGSLLTTTAQAAPDRSSAQPAAVTARASGTIWCDAYSECAQKRNHYLYLGCSATPVKQAQWHPGWYLFQWRC